MPLRPCTRRGPAATGPYLTDDRKRASIRGRVRAAAVACEKVIEVIRTDRQTPVRERLGGSGRGRCGLGGTENAWKRSRETGHALEFAEEALKAIEASQTEETGSDRAIAWLRITAAAHRAAAEAYKELS